MITRIKPVFYCQVNWLWLGFIWIVLCVGCAKIIVCPLKHTDPSKFSMNKIPKNLGVYLLDTTKFRDSSLQLDADYTEQRLQNENIAFQHDLLNTFRRVYKNVHLLDDDPLTNPGSQYELDLFARVEPYSIDFSSRGYKQTVTTNLGITFYDKRRAILIELNIHGKETGKLPKLSGKTMQEHNHILCNLRNNSVTAAMLELASSSPVPPTLPKPFVPSEITSTVSQSREPAKPKEPKIFGPPVELDSFIDNLSQWEKIVGAEIELKSDSWANENNKIRESEKLFRNTSNPDLMYEKKIKIVHEAIQILRNINSKISQIKRDDLLKQCYLYLVREHINNLINTEDEEEATISRQKAKRNLRLVYIIDPEYIFENDLVISAIPDLIEIIQEFYNDIFHSELSFMRALIDNLKTGSRLFSEDKYSEAEDYFKQAIELVKEDEHSEYTIELKHKLSLFYIEVANKKPEFAKKINLYNKSLEVIPDIFDAYFNLGVAYYNNRQLKKAWENFHKCEKLENSNKAVKHNIKLIKTIADKEDSCLQAKGLLNGSQSNASERELEKLRSMAKQDLQNYLLQYLLIMNELNRGWRNVNKDKLIQDCLEILGKDENFYPARNVLAYLLYKKGQIEQAKKEWSKVLGLEPGNSYAGSSLAKL